MSDACVVLGYLDTPSGVSGDMLLGCLIDAGWSVADLEEERRLFYVGVTRARDVLYLTRHKERVHRGRLLKISPSRFLQGLPEHDTQEYQSTGSRELERQEVADMAKALLERLGATSG